MVAIWANHGGRRPGSGDKLRFSLTHDGTRAHDTLNVKPFPESRIPANGNLGSRLLFWSLAGGQRHIVLQNVRVTIVARTWSWTKR